MCSTLPNLTHRLCRPCFLDSSLAFPSLWSVLSFLMGSALGPLCKAEADSARVNELTPRGLIQGSSISAWLAAWPQLDA